MVASTMMVAEVKLVSKELNHFGGNCSVFPVLGTGDTDRLCINKGLCAPVPNTGKMLQSSHSDLTHWSLTLPPGEICTSSAYFNQHSCLPGCTQMKPCPSGQACNFSDG